MRRIHLAIAIPAALAAAAWIVPRATPLPSWLLRGTAHEVVLLDREGGPIAGPPAGGADAARPVTFASVDPLLYRATLAAEDARFEHHPGIDPLALGRAAWRALARRRPLGGASTLTMQTVRLSRGRPRGVASRAAEIGWSLVLEAHRTKRQIVEAYWNRAPYGPGITGVGAASMRWLGKPPSFLSPSEAALLACLPRAPSRLDPARHAEAARRARDAVLSRMVRHGWLTPEAGRAAAAAPIEPAAAAASATAPHFAAWVMRTLGPDGERVARITTTLSGRLQATAESALRRRAAALRDRNVRGGAVVVLDAPAGEVLSFVGSADVRSPDGGQVDAALALRQPGSAVKPFTYAVAFAGGLRPSSILADVPTVYEDPSGTFAPRNYAGGFTGPVPARLALANSWNVPAVEVLRRAGPEEVARAFASVGLIHGDPRRLGLGLTLGAGEVSLVDLAAAYACLARGGVWIEPRAIREARDDRGEPVAIPAPESRAALDPAACAWVDEILSDPAARAAAFDRGGPLEMDGAVAAKTGTSSDWRDAWAVLYTTRHVVAVWMGNPDGSPTDRVTGAEGPAVVAREILGSLEGDAPAEPFPVPAGTERRAVCPLSGLAAGPDCPQVDWEPFRTSDPPLPACDVHVARTIDTATGRLARPCTPAERRRRAVFVRLPGRYASWLADRGLPSPPTEATPCACGREDCRPIDAGEAIAPDRGGGIVILRPVDGTVVAIDPTLPRDQQQLALEADAPAGVAVEWRIDGRPHAGADPAGRIFWPLAPGEHRIEALARGVAAVAVSRVTVLPPPAAGRAADPSLRP